MMQLREDLWKEKAEMIKEKDSLHDKLKELEERLKQVCTTNVCTVIKPFVYIIKYIEKLEYTLGLSSSEN